MARTLFISLVCLICSLQATADFSDKPVFEEEQTPFKMTAQKAHQLINEQQTNLLGDGTQLVSLYYFGQNQSTSVVGLERVGDDYLPIRWLLVFEHDKLAGWYYPVGEFPARFNDGHLTFPKGTADEDIYLFPHPPSTMVIEGIEIPFIPPHAISVETTP